MHTRTNAKQKEEENQLQLIESLNVIHVAAWRGTHGDNTAAVSDAYDMLAAFWTSLQARSSLLVPLRPTDPWKCPASLQGRKHRHNTGPKEPCLQESSGDLKTSNFLNTIKLGVWGQSWNAKHQRRYCWLHMPSYITPFICWHFWLHSTLCITLLVPLVTG